MCSMSYRILLYLWCISKSVSCAVFRENLKNSKTKHLINVYHYQTDNEVGNYPQSQFLYDHHPEARCMRCPKDKTVMAKRGADSVLMEKPHFGYCTNNRKRSKNVQAHILVGPKVGDVIAAGKYTIIMNLIHTVKPCHVRTCKFNYTVIVKKCRALHVRKHVQVKCTNDRKWGSLCSFSCTTGYKLVGPRRTKCMSNELWRKHPPYCKRKFWENDCRVPDFDGTLNCDTDASLESDMVSEGSVCQFECDDGFVIPKEIQHLAVVECKRGHWNTTQDPVCIPITKTSLAKRESGVIVKS